MPLFCRALRRRYLFLQIDILSSFRAGKLSLLARMEASLTKYSDVLMTADISLPSRTSIAALNIASEDEVSTVMKSNSLENLYLSGFAEKNLGEYPLILAASASILPVPVVLLSTKIIDFILRP